MGVSVSGTMFLPWGSLPRTVPVQGRGSGEGGGGALCSGGLCLVGIYLGGGLCRGGEERVVSILLECILVVNMLV